MIDSKLQASLRAKFNPDGSDLRNMQLRMLDMLKYIDKICRENNIKYWLSSGTCLGAVRHGGFIPWDDDVDIEMLEKDYESLKSILEKNVLTNYILQYEKTDSDYVQIFPKLRDLCSQVKEDANTDNWNTYKGCYIDIFILQPSFSKKIHRLCGLLWNYTIFPLVNIKNSRLRRICIKALRNSLSTVFGFISSLTAKQKKIYRHTLGCGFNKARYYSDIKDTIYIPFEDTLLPVPKGYEGYLNGIYGDYKAIPPIDEINPHFKSVNIW